MISLLLFLNIAFAYPTVPNVPGHLCTVNDPDFKEFRYAEQIPYCQRNVDYRTKSKIYAGYGIPQSEREQYTIDHIMPLAIGGSNSTDNLWPEHKEIKKCRNTLETDLYRAMRDGHISQTEAVATIKDVKYDKICTK